MNRLGHFACPLRVDTVEKRFCGSERATLIQNRGRVRIFNSKRSLFGAEGIYEHFARVADAASIPVVAYNNQGRTGINLDVRMLEKLTAIPSIVALKECERDLAVVAAKISAVGDRIAIMSGDDDLGLPTFLLGSPGGIFMSANLVPAFHRKLFEATVSGNLTVAKRAYFALLPLVNAVYTANHPGPLKDAMAFIGHPVGPARAPLQRASAENLALAKIALENLSAVPFV